jgi:hypothetical protein
MYEKGTLNIHLKVKRAYTPLVEGKKEKKWGQFYIFNVSNPLDNILSLFGKCPPQKEWKQIKFWTAL